MDGLMINDISQTEKDKYLYVITYMWNLKSTTASEYNKKRLIDVENKLKVTRGEREKGRGNTGVEIKRYKLRYKISYQDILEYCTIRRI